MAYDPWTVCDPWSKQSSHDVPQVLNEKVIQHSRFREFDSVISSMFEGLARGACPRQSLAAVSAAVLRTLGSLDSEPPCRDGEVAARLNAIKPVIAEKVSAAADDRPLLSQAPPVRGGTWQSTASPPLSRTPTMTLVSSRMPSVVPVASPVDLCARTLRRRLLSRTMATWLLATFTLRRVRSP